MKKKLFLAAALAALFFAACSTDDEMPPFQGDISSSVTNSSSSFVINWSSSSEPNENESSSSVTNGSSSSNDVGSSSSSGSEEGYAKLFRETITLSYVGSSFGDADEAQEYTMADLTANAGKIDLIAYANASAADKIYTPFGTEIDFAGSLDYFYDLCDDGNGMCDPYKVGFWELSTEVVSVLKKAVITRDDAVYLLDVAEDLFYNGDELMNVDVVADKAFLVLTSELNYRFALITDTGNKSVDLTLIGFLP